MHYIFIFLKILKKIKQKSRNNLINVFAIFASKRLNIIDIGSLKLVHNIFLSYFSVCFGCRS